MKLFVLLCSLAVCLITKSEAVKDVKKVLYPWAVATIGRGNPYHNISTEKDYNGVSYFDHYQPSYFGSPTANHKYPQEVNGPK